MVAWTSRNGRGLQRDLQRADLVLEDVDLEGHARLGRQPPQLRQRRAGEILVGVVAVDEADDSRTRTERRGKPHPTRPPALQLQVDSLLPEFYDEKYRNARYT